MVWFFERNAERLQYEIRHQDTGTGYELVIRADAEPTIERIASPSQVIERSQDVWSFLLDGGWRPVRTGSGL